MIFDVTWVWKFLSSHIPCMKLSSCLATDCSFNQSTTELCKPIQMTWLTLVLVSAASRFGCLYWLSLIYLNFLSCFCCRWRWSHSVLDFSSHCHECLFYVCCILSRCLQKWDSKLVSILLESLQPVLSILHLLLLKWPCEDVCAYAGSICKRN